MKYRTSYIYVRLTPDMKARLKSEASLLELSIQQYVVQILRFRKHARTAFSAQEVIASDV
jgi:hypothetical protein